MIQLEPREYFPITRQLDDPTDDGTYYVKAFIRNARTDELIDEVELNDLGDQRFSAEWQVPADPSGEGFYITITTKVYTDSEYSNESPNYAREQNQYLVQKRYNPVLGSGGGYTDYKKIREIVQEELKKVKIPKADFSSVIKAIKEIKIPKQKEINLKGIEKEIDSLKKEIKKIPEPQQIDLEVIRKQIEKVERKIEDIKIQDLLEMLFSEMERKINETNKRISSIKIPEPEKVDFNPAYHKINEENLKTQKEIEEIKNNIEEVKKQLKDGINLNIVGTIPEESENNKNQFIKRNKTPLNLIGIISGQSNRRRNLIFH